MKVKTILIVLIVIIFKKFAQSQTTDYNNLGNWENICYCQMNDAYHPGNIVNADNNWQLLLAMKNGLTRKQLDSLKIPYTKSQLLLLETQRLLSLTKNVYKTSIPILDSVQTTNLRKQSQLIANDIYPEIEKPCRDLIAHLSEQNRSNNAYSILFSYVLDGLIWERFEKENVAEKWSGTGIWSGNYWFLTPKRSFVCGGTNSWSNDDEGFKFSWNWSKIEHITDGLWEINVDTLFSLAQGNPVSSKEIIDEFGKFGFLDENLNLAIPIINEKGNNTLCLLSNNIIDKLFATFLAKTNIDALKTSYNFNDNNETLVIVYHEVMFDLMDLLMEKQVIRLPKAFQFPDEAILTDAADLSFIVIYDN
ncbi:MAG: hypothetical protein LBU83_11615 [Bacteroidales bacterium]|jgi:hypothetical protein|nr:hypothetical protein [Bacteroidales bacterium]